MDIYLFYFPLFIMIVGVVSAAVFSKYERIIVLTAAIFGICAGLLIGSKIQKVKCDKIHTVYYVEKSDTISVNGNYYVRKYYEEK